MDESVSPPQSAAAPEKGAAQQPQRGGSWGCGGVLMLLGLAALGWFLPSLVGSFASQNDVLQWTGTELPAEIQFASADLSWTAPVLLHEVQVSEQSGIAKADIKSVTSAQPLWELLRNPQAPLTLTLEGFEAEIVVPEQERMSSRNLDLGGLLQKILDSHCPAIPRPVELQVAQGTLKFVAQDGSPLATVSDLTGSYVFQSQDGRDHTARLTGQVTEPATQGTIRLEGSWKSPGQALDEKLELTVAVQQFPLAVLGPVLNVPTPAVGETVGGLTVLKLSHTPEHAISADWTGSFLAAAQGNGPAENTLQPLFPVDWQAQASFSPATDTVQFNKFQFNSSPFKATGQGNITRASVLPVIDVTAALQGDMQPILKILPEPIQQNVRFEGVRWSGVRIQGPLNSAAENGPAASSAPSEFPGLQVSANIAWDRVDAYGLTAAPGELSASVSDGWLRLNPTNVVVNGGQVRQLPTIALADEHYHFTGQSGLVLDHIQLTEPLVQRWLQYVAPLLANSTSVQGDLSLELAGPAQGEFGFPEKMDVPGYITVHQATVGPGPLIRQITGAVEQIALITGNRLGVNDRLQVTLQDQKFAFRVLEGRVHHKDFGMSVGQVQVLSNGSVGLDETLDMTISVALPDAWLQKPVLKTLQGESIALAVRGTLDQPQLDLRPLGDLGKRIGVKAAGGLLDRILNGGR